MPKIPSGPHLSLSTNSGQNYFSLNELMKNRYILKKKTSYIELLECLARWIGEDKDLVEKNQVFRTNKGSLISVQDNGVVIIDTQGQYLSKDNDNQWKSPPEKFIDNMPSRPSMIKKATDITEFEMPSFWKKYSEELVPAQITTENQRQLELGKNPT